MKERIKALEATVLHLREIIRDLETELVKPEWPTEERIDNIGPNGNTGEHYAKIKSHTLEK